VPVRRPPAAAKRPAAGRASTPPRPLDEAELAQLEALLARVPAPLEALDASMLDGFLCGLLVQPGRVPPARWLPFVTDVDGRPLPAGFDTTLLHALVRRRHAELDAAIEARQWFDPWVFELESDAADPAETPDDDTGDLAGAPPEVDAVYPWVAGFVTALDHFPALMAREGPALNDALVLLYRHLDPDDLEDADDIMEAIEALEPPESLAVAVEELVRATLLLADIGRPAAGNRPRPPQRRR
jgi:uncharacterized protein